MDDFFDKYMNLIRFVLYAIAVLLGLIIAFLIIQTSEIWSGALSEVWKGVMPFFIAFLLAYIIHPFISWFERLKIPRLLAVLLFYVIVLGTIVIAIAWFLPKLIKETYELGQNLPNYLTAMGEQLPILEQYLGFNISEWLFSESSTWTEGLSDGFQDLSLWVFDLVFYFIGSLTFLMIVPIALFYFLMDYEKIMGIILKIFPKKFQYHIKSIGMMLDSTLGVYIRGLILVVLMVSLIATLLFTIFGINYALLFGFIIGISGVIPVVGPVIGAIPVAIFALSISWHHVLVVILIQVFLQIIEGNILQPIIIGRKLEMHPLLIMMLILVVGRIFGMVGIIFAIPSFLLFRTLREYWKNYKKS